ncbi:MAG: phosphoglycerate kinase [Verrucomicrobia bacterium]|nr:phosphoglycerate kinase [Verrucomicrobiota bacterium]
MAKLFIEDLDVRGKRVLTRVDFNVPLDDSRHVTDDTRVRASLPTIRRIIDGGGKAVLMSHLGRPKKVDDKLRMEPVGAVLAELIGKPVKTLRDCIGPEVETAVAAMVPGDVVLLENLRFHPEEEKNDAAFAGALAKLGDVYVNDAFGSSHRAHASVVGVTEHIAQCACGYLIRTEIRFLDEALREPKTPFVVILGGAKVSTKIAVIERLMDKAGTFLIGGGMSYTFLKAQGLNVGDSLLEADHVGTAKDLLVKAAARKVTFLLPVDYVVADKFNNEATSKLVAPDGIEDGWQGVDIGPKTVEAFAPVIAKAGTVFWNGPLGVFEMPNFAKGTFAVAQLVADSKAVSVIGGGDSASAIKQAGLADRITHISTGGGASMEYVENGELPGINALTEA